MSDIVTSPYNDYYVYGHYKTGEENIPFYIGFGRGRRAKSKEKRNKHWHGVVSKYGYHVKLLCEGITQTEAKELEIQLIGMFGRNDLGRGPLVNKTDGGDCSSGRKFEKGHVTWNKGVPQTEETKQKVSASKKGQLPWNTGKKRPKYSKEWCKKISDGHKGIPKSEAHKQALKAAWVVRKQKKADLCQT